MSEEINFYPIEKILLPTDGSEFCIKAARYAAKVANKHNSKVTILHVIDLHSPNTLEPIKIHDLNSVIIQIENETILKDRTQKIINKTKKILIKENIQFEIIYILFGNIPENIVKIAEEDNFDLIIMGHKGLSGIKRAVLGSVAESARAHI
jgi:nucleotide-binding universal stress UspA family protein